MIPIAVATVLILILFKTVPSLKQIELDTFIALALVLAPAILVLILRIFVPNMLVMFVVELLAYVGIPAMILKSGANLPTKKALLLGLMVYGVVLVASLPLMLLGSGA